MYEEIKLVSQNDNRVRIIAHVFEDGYAPRKSMDASYSRIKLSTPISGIIYPNSRVTIDIKVQFSELNDHAVFISKNPGQQKFSIVPQLAYGPIKITMDNPTPRSIHYHKGEKLACASVVKTYVPDLIVNQPTNLNDNFCSESNKGYNNKGWLVVFLTSVFIILFCLSSSSLFLFLS